MSIYVKLEEDDFAPNDKQFKASGGHDDGESKGGKTGKTKVVPPAPVMHFPDDDSMQYMADALFTDSQEYTRPIHCEIEGGEMPAWIKGTFIRVGPGRFHWGEAKVGHLFDGDSIAHRFTVKDGSVTYQSKFLKTKYHLKNEKYNTVSASGFGTWAPPDPCANIFQRIAMYFMPSFENDNSNVNVFKIQGKTYVATETPWMVELDKDTLETIKLLNARDNLSPYTASWLAHPHFEPDGTAWFISTKRFPSQRYEIIKIPPTPGPRPLEGIEIFTTLYPGSGEPSAGYYHSFCVTENYIILITNPLYINTCAVLTINFTHDNLANLLKYHPEVGPRFRIVDKRTGQELRECRCDPMFFFHSANSYETEDEIILDLVTYQDDDIIKFVYMKNCENFFKGKNIKPPNLCRYRIPKHEVLKSDPEPFHLTKIRSEGGRDNEVLFGCIELPIYNYDLVNGKDYKYLYGQTGLFKDAALVKVNVKTKEALHWHPPKDVIPSNPYFVQRPGGTREDDGVILANCTGAKSAESFFLVLDATTMKEICRANMWVGFGAMIHGAFFPEN